ncbi:hypothetical protein EDC02_2232 [Micromonospora sp. Llam0]|uniref:hypothetical protein n=1 Tax=Micromonospora sp. Llam0 TaxID=2485143 RepID=UPI000F930EE9|nr:hypothetical protein [Micromonospora sp. Llam0]ROO60369.1 hypothetical protein EDC02_2232 [Micromonospora sp. Llam0]
MRDPFIRLLTRGSVAMRARPDRGAQTVEVMLWIAAVIVIVGVVGVILRDDLKAFFENISYTIGFTGE